MAASPHAPYFDPESPVFRAHEGGKLGVHATKPLEGREDLALLYTPGVAEVSLAIAADPALSMRYTARGNTVAVISDGTAVLGLGDIGPLGAMPVMEGKAVLFKHFAGIDAVPVVMETGTVEELVEAIARIAPSFGGINLEDISAPRCFDIEEQLKERLDIPVFHDDQHGTAIVVLAGLLNAAKVLGRQVPDLRVVVSGAGAAGVAVTRLLQRAGVRDVVVCDSRGIISPARQDLTGHKSRLAASTNPRALHGRLGIALEGADVFVGVSGGQVPEEEIASMAPRSMVFALANPTPEVHPDVARRHAAVVATGRSDFPNQINNVLAFPGIFRGALDAGATQITEAMKLAAAHAIADLVEEPTVDCIVPSVFQEGVAEAVAAAVLLREGLAWARPGAFEVTSAGTHALVGRPMDEGSVARLDAKGLADDEFRARLITPGLLQNQAVVLLMAGEHREFVLDEAPAVHRRTFTIRELAQALDAIAERHSWLTLMAAAGASDVVSRWRVLPDLVSVHSRRGRGARLDRDVSDPYKRGDRAFDRMVAELDPAVRSIVMWERQFER